jgi:LacI family transcriptional regulator
MAEEYRPKSVGIKEIARALDLSIGTVDRALHGRPGINPMTRTRVLAMAQTMGYRPNLAARFLKSGKKLRLSVHTPRELASFFDPLRLGIRETARLFENSVQVLFRSHRRLGEGETEIFEQALGDEVNGFIVVPGHPGELRGLIRKAARQGKPVVCVATDAPGTERLTCVSADAFVNGAMVGELLCRFVRCPGDFVVITGNLSTVDHAEKLRGFDAAVKSMACGNTTAVVLEAHDDEQQAFESTRKVLRERPDLRGIYVSTANSLSVLRALEDAGRAGEIPVITTDFFPELVPLIRSGKILATIHQRPLSQGRIAFRALYQFLAEEVCPPAHIRLVPHVVMKSNLDLFLESPALEFELASQASSISAEPFR